jgi:thiamine-monophosphate kinase
MHWNSARVWSLSGGMFSPDSFIEVATFVQGIVRGTNVLAARSSCGRIPALRITDDDMFRSETEFVRWLERRSPQAGRHLRLGIGDDAALVRVSRGNDLILTTDLSLEGVHFRRGVHPPRSIGHRALARSLSDVAAMGGTPRFALVSLAIAKRATRAWLEEFYAGLRALAKQFGVAVIGGDTAVVPEQTAVDVVLVGEVRRGRALLRSGARPGDQIFVSGRLGLSALGLRLLRAGKQVGGYTGGAEAIAAHLSPQPQCALGRYLSEKRLASALIDISDGLSTDLGHLMEASGVGARIWASLIPAPEIPASRAALGMNPLELALHGGEDYQLLFSVPPSKVSRVPRRFRGLPLQRIGEIIRRKALRIVRTDGRQEHLRPAGYDHFRNWVA